MKNLPRFLIGAFFLALAAAASATTVIPPSFDELVTRAQIIFQGTVTDVRSAWTGEGAQRCIVTFVTFKVEDAIKGNPGKEMTLRMLGGTVGTETMQVSDAPRFTAGDRDVLFVENNGRQFIPLVGIMHGRYRVYKDENGHELVLTNEGTALSSTDQVGREAAAQGQAMTVEQFKQAVRARASAGIP